jgi:hypothetical protein
VVVRTEGLDEGMEKGAEWVRVEVGLEEEESEWSEKFW